MHVVPCQRSYMLRRAETARVYRGRTAVARRLGLSFPRQRSFELRVKTGESVEPAIARVRQIVLCAVFMGVAAGAAANTIFVNSVADAADPGKCTLREAITAANTNASVGVCAAGSPYPAMDTINLFSQAFCELNKCSISLSSALPAVSEDATFHGVADPVTINGKGLYRIFDLQGVVVHMDNLRLINGSAVGLSDAGYGGAINMSSNGTTLIVTNVTFSNNHAQTRGGALMV